jgi:hypothetical protein
MAHSLLFPGPLTRVLEPEMRGRCYRVLEGASPCGVVRATAGPTNDLVNLTAYKRTVLIRMTPGSTGAAKCHRAFRAAAGYPILAWRQRVGAGELVK